MNIFKRWGTTLVSNFDTVMSKVENHEAIAESTIRSMQRAAAKARVKLARLRSDGESVRSRITALEAEEEKWRERAVAVHESDRERALECVRRRNRAAAERTHLEAEVSKHQNLERSLASELEQVEARIAELKRRMNRMSARELRARASSAVDLSEQDSLLEVNDIFTRWEEKLALTETLTGVTMDEFSAAFEREEQAGHLEAELDDLIASESSDRGPDANAESKHDK